MDTKILALYLGCTASAEGYSTGVVVSGVNLYSDKIQNVSGMETVPIDDIKLRLRPLSSMTNQQACKLINLKSEVYLSITAEVVNQHLLRFEFEYASSGRRRSSTQRFDELSPAQFLYLISEFFDLFGLIEKGEAIDATTLTQKP